MCFNRLVCFLDGVTNRCSLSNILVKNIYHLNLKTFLILVLGFQIVQVDRLSFTQHSFGDRSVVFIRPPIDSRKVTNPRTRSAGIATDRKT